MAGLEVAMTQPLPAKTEVDKYPLFLGGSIYAATDSLGSKGACDLRQLNAGLVSWLYTYELRVIWLAFGAFAGTVTFVAGEFGAPFSCVQT